MARRGRHKPGKPDPMELEDQHCRRPWTGLKANDELISQHWSSEQIAQQRRRCHRLVNGEGWEEMFGAK